MRESRERDSEARENAKERSVHARHNLHGNGYTIQLVELEQECLWSYIHCKNEQPILGFPEITNKGLLYSFILQCSYFISLH